MARRESRGSKSINRTTEGYITMSEYLTIKETSDYLNCSTNLVKRLVRKAELDSEAVNGTRTQYIASEQINEMIERKQTGKKVPALSDILSGSKRVPTSAIYFLIDKEMIVYIGLSKNVFDRIGRHIKEGKKIFSKYKIIETPSFDIKGYESRLIRHFKPKYNISENM